MDWSLNEKERSLDLLADAATRDLNAVEEREQPALEDLADVDISQFALQAAQQPLGLGDVLIFIAAGDLTERLSTAGHAEPDGAGKVGVEHQEADHPDRFHQVALGAQIRPVRRTASQKTRPSDQLEAHVGTARSRREAVTLGVQNPADHVNPFQVSAQPEEMVDLVARQGILDQSIEEDTRLLDRGIKPRWAGLEPAAVALATEIEVKAVDLSPGVYSETLLGAAGVLSCPRNHAEDRLSIRPVEGEEVQNGGAFGGRMGGTEGLAACEDVQSDLDRGRPVVDGSVSGIELQIKPDIEKARNVLGTFEVATHPVEVLSHPAQHDRIDSPQLVRGSSR